jgi:hypothetical protein
MKRVASIVVAGCLALMAFGCADNGPSGAAGNAVGAAPGGLPTGNMAPPEDRSVGSELLAFDSDVQGVAGMSDEQRKKVDALRMAAVKEVLPRRAALKVLSADLTTLLLAEKPDAGAVAGKVAQAQKVLGEIADIDFRLLVDFKGLMTADQARTFDQARIRGAENLFGRNPGGGAMAAGAQAGAQVAPVAGGAAGGTAGQAGAPGAGTAPMGAPGMVAPGMGAPGMMMGVPPAGAPGMVAPGMMGVPPAGAPGMVAPGMMMVAPPAGAGQQGYGQAPAGGTSALSGADAGALPPCDGRPGPCQAACPLAAAAAKPAKK